MLSPPYAPWPKARRASGQPPGLLDILGDRFSRTALGGLLGFADQRPDSTRPGMGEVLADHFVQTPMGGLIVLILLLLLFIFVITVLLFRRGIVGELTALRQRITGSRT